MATINKVHTHTESAHQCTLLTCELKVGDLLIRNLQK